LEAIESTTPPTTIPWAVPAEPLAESRVALLTTAGISMRGDPPFDMETERNNPVWGDPSWRKIRFDATHNDIVVNHLHIDTTYIENDINVALPLLPLRDLVTIGVVGSSAPNHYSIIGFQGADSSVLENVSAPEIAQAMKNDEVDLAILAPV
jgi:D-proline reductase (dithiol) PrdB